jgi:non-ribosomal peptide synthetase component E (peptide arylation enzyme)
VAKLAPEDNSISVLARALAESSPDAEAISGDGDRLNYASLYTSSEALAAGLWEMGLRAGDVVSFQLPNWIETAILNIAASRIGLVCNPIVSIYRDAEVRAILFDARSRCLFVPGVWRGYDYAAMAARLWPDLPDLQHIVTVRASAEDAVRFADLLAAGEGRCVLGEPARADDLKLLLFTSGTTGRAKGVRHSHRSLTAPLLRALKRWELRDGDAILMPSPVTHVTGYCCGLELPFTLNTRTVLMERWNADAAIDLIEGESIAATVGATPFLEELVDAAERKQTRLASFKIFACGGASVPPALINRANAALDGQCFRVYGASEAPLVTYGATSNDAPHVAATTDGKNNGYEIRIVDAQGAPVAHDHEGEILVRGAGLFLGYSDPQSNAVAFTADGFFRTGDLGQWVDDDALVITGRKKDLIIRGGENISAREIEDALLHDQRIRDAAAVAMPHERLGETVGLFVVLAPHASGLTLSEVAAILEGAGLARQKFPERMIVLEDLPKTPSGKVRKDRLRELIAS